MNKIFAENFVISYKTLQNVKTNREIFFAKLKKYILFIFNDIKLRSKIRRNVSRVYFNAEA